jgi:hypothetical protein
MKACLTEVRGARCEVRGLPVPRSSLSWNNDRCRMSFEPVSVANARTSHFARERSEP